MNAAAGWNKLRSRLDSYTAADWYGIRSGLEITPQSTGKDSSLNLFLSIIYASLKVLSCFTVFVIQTILQTSAATPLLEPKWQVDPHNPNRFWLVCLMQLI
jgi:hypothetical protein